MKRTSKLALLVLVFALLGLSPTLADDSLGGVGLSPPTVTQRP